MASGFTIPLYRNVLRPGRRDTSDVCDRRSGLDSFHGIKDVTTIESKLSWEDTDALPPLNEATS